VRARSSSPGTWPGAGIVDQSCGQQQLLRNMVGKTVAAAPGCTVRHHPRPMAVYKHAVNVGDHCGGFQARIIDLQTTHKMRLRILSLLTDRS
jgi:hypothetical protein